MPLENKIIEKYDLEQCGRDIITFKNAPKKLDDILMDLSGWYAYYSDKLVELDLKESKFYLDHKNPPEGEKLNDKNVEALWKLTFDGSNHVRVKQYLKAIEKLMSNIKSSIRMAEAEARNQM